MSSSIFSLLQMGLIRYVNPIITILGNIGNMLIVILFCRHRQNSCSTFLSWSAVMNSATITLYMIYIVYSSNYGDPTINSLALCKLRFYIAQTCIQTARYLIILACFDRFILTTNCAYFFRLINRPVVRRSLVGIVFIFWCICLNHLFFLTTINNKQCGQFDINYILYFAYYITFMYSFPIIFMSVFGFLTYRNMRRLHSRIQPVQNTSDNSTTTIVVRRRDRDLLIMTFTEVFIYIVATLPYPITMLEVTMTDFVGITKTTERLQIENFFSTFSVTLINLNCSVPFYTYLIVSKVFRRDFKRFFTKCRRRVAELVNLRLNSSEMQQRS